MANASLFARFANFKFYIMNCMTRIFVTFAVLAFFPEQSIAEDEAELTTLDGKSFSEVKITRVENGQLVISHASGMASIDLQNLPEDFRERHELLPDFQEIRNLFQAACEGWAAGYTRLNSQYESALEGLKASVPPGEPEIIEEIDKEIGHFREFDSALLSDHPDLRRLQESYRKFRERWDKENSPRLISLVKTYAQKLKEVELRSDPEDAALARKERLRFEAVQNSPDEIQVLLEFGPGIIKVEQSVRELSPDGDPAKKRPARFTVTTAGPRADIRVPTGGDENRILAIHGNWDTWAALRSGGQLISSRLDGDEEIPEDHEEVIWFRAGAGVVVAFHPNGSFSTFGSSEDAKDNPPENLGKIRELALDRGSGIALQPDGKIRVWGSMYDSKDDIARVEETLENIEFIAASQSIAWAVNQSGDIFSWNRNANPVIIANHQDIIDFGGGRSAYLVLTGKGDLKGGGLGGSENPVVHVPDDRRFGKRIHVDGWGYALQYPNDSWFTWGGPPESAIVHGAIQTAGPLADLQISAAPGCFVMLSLQD